MAGGRGQAGLQRGGGAVGRGTAGQLCLNHGTARTQHSTGTSTPPAGCMRHQWERRGAPAAHSASCGLGPICSLRCSAQVVNFAFLEDPAEAFPHVTWAKLDRLGYALELWQGVDWVVELGGAADEAAGMPGEPGARARIAVLWVAAVPTNVCWLVLEGQHKWTLKHYHA